jgi:ABC-type dipeptide/oligopeptide/nickel transport system permease component
MHNILFVMAWLLAITCPFLPKKFLLFGTALFFACQLALWHFTLLAMSSPNWDDSAGDAFIPLLITFPSVLILGLLAARGAFFIFIIAFDKLYSALERRE